jgi:MFS family permease
VPRRWWTLVAVGLATFMTYLDNNVTNVAIPTIQRDLHLSIAGLEWVVSSYILVFAGLLLVGGRLADGGCSSPGCRCSRWPPWARDWRAAAAC